MSFLIAGTGTGIGKTLVTAALVSQLGAPWRACKPVASGAVGSESDPAILAHAQNAAEADICLYSFPAPLPPHRAAEKAGVRLDWENIVDFCQGEALIIEGAGGLFSPLTAQRTNADLAHALALPVILVAGSYLGTLSHTVATLRAAAAESVRVAGIIISQNLDSATPESVAEDLRALEPALPPLFLLPRIHGAEAWRHLPDLRQWLGETGVAG